VVQREAPEHERSLDEVEGGILGNGNGVNSVAEQVHCMSAEGAEEGFLRSEDAVHRPGGGSRTVGDPAQRECGGAVFLEQLFGRGEQFRRGVFVMYPWSSHCLTRYCNSVTLHRIETRTVEVGVTTTAIDTETSLAYDIEGSGTPVVFLHGLTFDRRTWGPVVERFGGSVMSVAIDLPAHGASRGEPMWLEPLTERIHQLLTSLGVERPIVVGHSMAAAIAGIYGSTYPARGVVMVDQAMEVLPFAQMVHQVAPMLRGPAFDQVWANIEDSLGLDRILEPTRTLVLDTHKVRQDVVLGYWEQLLTTEPTELQQWIDGKSAGIRIPCLAVFGRTATDGERERFDRMPDAQIEEWAGDGHFVHLVDAERFTTRLRAFVEYCDQQRSAVAAAG